MSKETELVEDMKRAIRSFSFSSPSIEEVQGEWMLFEQEGRTPRILVDDGSGFFNGEPYTVDRIREFGWTVTPVMVHKVTAIR